MATGAELTEHSLRCTDEDVAGWSGEAIMDIAEVSAVSNFTNRLASGPGWRPNDELAGPGLP